MRIDDFERKLKKYAQVSAKRSQPLHLIFSGIGDRFFGAHHFDRDQTAEAKASNAMTDALNKLVSDFGISSEVTHRYFSSVSHALAASTEDIDKGVKDSAWILGAAAAAPAAYLVAPLVSTGAWIFTGISGALSAGGAALEARQEAFRTQTNFSCNFGKQLLTEGPQFFISSLVFGGAWKALKFMRASDRLASKIIATPYAALSVSYAVKPYLPAAKEFLNSYKQKIFHSAPTEDGSPEEKKEPEDQSPRVSKMKLLSLR